MMAQKKKTDALNLSLLILALTLVSTELGC